MINKKSMNKLLKKIKIISYIFNYLTQIFKNIIFKIKNKCLLKGHLYQILIKSS